MPRRLPTLEHAGERGQIVGGETPKDLIDAVMDGISDVSGGAYHPLQGL